MKSTRYANVTSTLALVFAVGAFCLGGAVAAEQLIDSGDIQNGSVKSTDLAKNAVKSPDVAKSAIKSSDIGTGAVTSDDIGEGEVEPVDVSLPPPGQLAIPPGAAPRVEATTEFQQVAEAGVYTKQDPTSVLEVSWTGTANSDSISCVFQVRVNGQSGGATGEVFVGEQETISLSSTALFSNLPAGPQTVSVWARLATPYDGPFPHACNVGPPGPGIPQTFVVSEVVV